VEEEESAHEHEEREGAHGEDEVPPAPVVFLATAGLDAAGQVAALERLRTGVIGNERPCDERSHERSDGPPNREEGQEVAGRER